MAKNEYWLAIKHVPRVIPDSENYYWRVIANEEIDKSLPGYGDDNRRGTSASYPHVEYTYEKWDDRLWYSYGHVDMPMTPERAAILTDLFANPTDVVVE